MQGSTQLAISASRVQRQFKQDVEDALLGQLVKWQSGGSCERQRLGDPGTVVLETKLVVFLGERLCTAPWRTVATKAARDNNHGALSALQLLRTLFAIVHDGNAAAASGSSGQPDAQVLQALLQQVWRHCLCCCRVLSVLLMDTYFEVS